MSKKLGILAIFLTLLLLVSEAIIYESGRKPVDTPIALTAKSEINMEFWILLPGTYHLELVMDNTKPNAINTLKSVFGEFLCWNIKNDLPCGEYLTYSIHWEILTGNNVLTSGVGTEKERGGHIGNSSFGKELGEMQLPAGHLRLRATVENPLPEVIGLDPRIVMSGGNGAAKSTQSSLVAFIVLFWILGRVFLWYVAGLLWVAVIVLWLRTRKLKASESELCA